MCSVASPLPTAGASLGSGIVLSGQASLACLDLERFHSLPLLFYDTGICGQLSLCPFHRAFSFGACLMLPRDQVEMIGSRVEYCRGDMCSQGHPEGTVSICPSLCSLSHGDMHPPLYSHHGPVVLQPTSNPLGRRAVHVANILFFTEGFPQT